MTTLEKLEELIYVGFKETDKKWQETDKKWQETDKKWQETDKKWQETDKKWQETDKKSRETDRKIRELRQETRELIGALTSKWGRFVEGLVAPAAVRLFAERGIVVTDFAQRVKRRRGEEGIEVDILATNGEYAVLIEVKSTLEVDDVKEHLDRLSKFERFFPEYTSLKAVGAVAGIEIVGDADKFAYRQGLFVIAQSGDTVIILNDEKFTPKIW